MHKINTETATQNGEFTDGDELQSIAPTDLNAAWFNSVQRELINILAAFNISPDPSNDGQLWTALQKMGVRCDFSDDEEIDVSDFSGTTVIFHSAADFDIVGTLTKGSVVIIAPYWRDDSSDSILVSYGSATTRIRKWSIFIGFAANGEGDLELAGQFVPMLGSSGKLTVGALETASVKAAKHFEISFVDFEYTTDEPELQGQQTWQLAENWELNQVKRVRCTNAPEGGVEVVCYGNSSGAYLKAYFYPASYREFTCIGTYTSGGYTWAVLNVEGRP